MLIATVMFGSVLGLFAALVSYFALGLGLLSAFMLYLACSIVPAIIAVALSAAQLVVGHFARQGLALR